MARLRHGGDHVLLGLPPRDPFSGNAVAPPPGGLLQRKSSAVDFSDVFGGPTRRASLYEPRRGVGECAESYGFGRIGVGEDAGERSRRWSSSVAEKPALGGVGVGSPAHRRHLGDDFFSDIFRGNGDSPCPTLRKKDRADVLASTPVSRVLSPACPLPSTGDVLVRSFSTAGHSFPTILAKSYDYSSFRSPTAYGVCKNEEMIPDVFSVPASPNAYAAANSNHLIRTKGSKANGGSGHFHFSIFKWASKGVTLIMPSNFKERTKSGSRFSEASPQVSRQEELPPDNEYLPNRVMSFQNQGEIDDKNPLSDLALAENENMDSSNEVTKLFPAASDIKSVLPGITDKSDDVHTCIKNSTSFPLEAAKLESVDLCHLLDDSDREGNEGITKKAKKEESLVSDCKTVMKGADGTAEVKQENRKNTILHYTEKVGKGMNYPSINSQDKMLSSRPQGKVKAFRKIFNEETGQRTGGTREVQASRYKVKDEIKGIVEDHASAHVVNAREDVGNNIEPLSTPIATGQNLKKAEQTISVRSSDARKIDGPFSEMNSTSVALSDSTVDSLDASFCNIDEAHFESIGEHMVEELSQDQNKVTEADLHQEEVQVETSDTRIQDWSKGKERNIRSLLSTLQYVLWPGSGWKAVALVDIIEGVSVRRAYQKALLCLHPDKLQQKGAEMHEKYIAEKVFDILQGAWTSFNSLSSLTL